jgi:hypothetical protein
MNKIWILPIVSILVVLGIWITPQVIHQAAPQAIEETPQVVESAPMPMARPMLHGAPEVTTPPEEEVVTAAAPESTWIQVMDMLLKYIKELSTTIITILNAVILMRTARKKNT